MRKFSAILILCVYFFSCESNDLQETEKILIVASHKSDCVGVAPQQCLLVKENENQNWHYFYDSIVGFTYEVGFEYKILVSQKAIENPPQDASSIETKLIEIVSKIEKLSENLPI
tara:strand:- start:9784 stop:10128 length:345 start_codon:yes stop_codon:yes gene_type:complete